MAKSRLQRVNQKIAEKVVDTFGKIESAVVGGYTQIEDGFVGRYCHDYSVLRFPDVAHP